MSVPRSVRDAESAHDYATGWKRSIQSEVDRNINLFEIRVVPFMHYHITAKEYGNDRVSIGNIVVAFRAKTKPDGTPMDDPDATRKTMSSTGAAELEQLARATKAVIGFRIFFRELMQSHLVLGPTPIFTDAQAVLDGTHCRRVSRESKWVCINLALIR